MRPLHDEYDGTAACNDTDSRPTLRTQSSRHLSCRISRCPSAARSVNWANIVSLTSSCGSCIRGCNGSACPSRQSPMANRPFTIRPSTKSLPSGPMMGRCGGRLWPVCGIWRHRNSSTSACSMATGPIPWPKKGGWHWLLGLQTPEGREGHCHHRQSWLRPRACPCESREMLGVTPPA